MNNSRYLEAFEMGRVDLLARNGMGKFLLQNKLAPVIGAVSVTYRLQLRSWQKYKVHSKFDFFFFFFSFFSSFFSFLFHLNVFFLSIRLVGCDEKWFYIEQDMVSLSKGEEKIFASIIVKALVLKNGKALPSAKLFEAFGTDGSKLIMPSYIKDLNESHLLKYESLKEREKEMGKPSQKL